MKIQLAIAATAVLIFMSGCVGNRISEFTPPPGLIVSSYKAPVCIDFDKTLVGTAGGKASANYIHDVILTGLNVAWGDCSLAEANAMNGTKYISNADYSYLSVLGIYQNVTVQVRNN